MASGKGFAENHASHDFPEVLPEPLEYRQKPQDEEPEESWQSPRSPKFLHLLANLIIDTLIVAAWPFILLFPMAFVGAFGNPPQLFLGPIHENVGKLEPPFIGATTVMLGCAALVNLWRYSKGSSHRALEGWELLPPVCFLLGIPSVVVILVLGGLVHVIFRLPVNFPVSAAAIWGAALTPAILLVAFEFIDVERRWPPIGDCQLIRLEPYWDGTLARLACAATMAVFIMLSVFA
jgi:hypothetical protein